MKASKKRAGLYTSTHNEAKRLWDEADLKSVVNPSLV